MIRLLRWICLLLICACSANVFAAPAKKRWAISGYSYRLPAERLRNFDSAAAACSAVAEYSNLYGGNSNRWVFVSVIYLDESTGDCQGYYVTGDGYRSENMGYGSTVAYYVCDNGATPVNGQHPEKCPDGSVKQPGKECPKKCPDIFLDRT